MLKTKEWTAVVQYLQPASENKDLYRKIRAKDPAIQELAGTIKKDGLLEPIVITQDFYILSGHRRAVACKVAGLIKVPVRIVPFTHDDPRFLTLLREFNRQRVKGVDEILRESIEGALDLDRYNAEVAELDDDDTRILQVKAKADKLLRGIQ